MLDYKNIKKLLLPGIKGLPIILLCLVAGVFLASRLVNYTAPVYESTVKIRLDELYKGVSNSNLYKNFDVFSTTNELKTEVEMLRSPLLIEKTLNKLDFDVSYYREGTINTTELYHESPFIVAYQQEAYHAFNKSRFIRIEDTVAYTYCGGDPECKEPVQGIFGKPLVTKDGVVEISFNHPLVKEKPYLKVKDLYSFTVHTMADQVNTVIGDKLRVIELDKDIAIIRIMYKSQVAEKTSAFVNTLAHTYINDYINTKVNAADKTISFIDARLDEIGKRLVESEYALEQFKKKNKVVNTRQETETGLRKIAQLHVQRTGLEMKSAALDSLHQYILSGHTRFMEMAPNFEGTGGLLYAELVKSLRNLEAEKKDKLLRYQPGHEYITAIDAKINDIISYIKKSIENHRNELKIQLAEIEQAVLQAESVFDNLPYRERKMVILERNFLQHEKMYNFLNEKRTEAEIARAATISFHRIIQEAHIPEEPVSPKGGFMKVVYGFLGLLLGLTIVYGRHYLGARVQDRGQLEKLSNIPVLGIIPKFRKKKNRQKAIARLAGLLFTLPKDGLPGSILIASTMRNEGKTATAQGLAKELSSMQYKVLLVDCNWREDKTDNEAGLADAVLRGTSMEVLIDDTKSYDRLAPGEAATPESVLYHKNFTGVLTKCKEKYDVVIVDSPATSAAPDALFLKQHLDLTLYMCRAGKTPVSYAAQVDHQLVGDQPVYWILNGVHRATSYHGLFTGSRFGYRKLNGGWKQKIRHYYTNYMA